jgi:hypothetical protein
MELNQIVSMRDEVFTLRRGAMDIFVRVVDVTESKGFGVLVTVTPVAGFGRVTCSVGELGKVE